MSRNTWPKLGLLEPKRKLNARVTYSDPCHLAHAQGIRKQPRELLKAIGAKLVEMPRADSCCGSAGVYNVVQNEISMKILDEKMEYVAMVEPEIVATANVGCMLQLAAGARRKGLNAKVEARDRAAGSGLLKPSDPSHKSIRLMSGHDFSRAARCRNERLSFSPCKIGP